MQRFRKAACLFQDFFKFGCFTFGGGFSIVAQMKALYVDERKTLAGEDLLDLTSVGRSLPGQMIANIAVLFGYRTCGIWGALACLFGLILPPFVLLSAISLFYAAFRDNYWVNAALLGIRAAVAPIIASAVLGIVKGAFRNAPCVLVSIVTFVLYLFFDVSCVALVGIGIISGFLIAEIYERRLPIK